MPVEDAADEGRDQEDAGLGAGDGLREREQQRQVAVDAFVLQQLGGADAFPGRGDLDQDALAADAGSVVELRSAGAPWRSSPRCRRRVGIDFGRDAAGHDLEDFAADRHRQPVAGIAARLSSPAGRRDRGIDVRLRRRAARPPSAAATDWWCVQRLEAGDGLDVAGVGDDDGMLAELFELGGHVGRSRSGLAGIVADAAHATNAKSR